MIKQHGRGVKYYRYCNQNEMVVGNTFDSQNTLDLQGQNYISTKFNEDKQLKTKQ